MSNSEEEYDLESTTYTIEDDTFQEPSQHEEEEEPVGSKQKKLQPLSVKNLQKFNEKHDKTGVLYISRVPPHMRPHKLRTLLQQFGSIGRLYLSQEGTQSIDFII